VIFISHRGNVAGANKRRENTCDYIDEAIEEGYDVEVDVRFMGGSLFLGHDCAERLVPLKWLAERRRELWIHAKNVDALLYLVANGEFKVFAHSSDPFTFIHNANLAWIHDLDLANNQSIIPLIDKVDSVERFEIADVRGVCSDYISFYEGKFKTNK